MPMPTEKLETPCCALHGVACVRRDGPYLNGRWQSPPRPERRLSSLGPVVSLAADWRRVHVGKFGNSKILFVAIDPTGQSPGRFTPELR